MLYLVRSLVISILALVILLPTIVYAGTGTIEDGKLNLSVLFTYREDDPNGWRPMFEEANRLLYNASNGQLQLGTIQVYNCGYNKTDVDVWILNNNSGAFATLFGLGEEGHVFLSQTHESSSGTALGQFGLVHEIGHYAFGLYDEYKGEVEPALLTMNGDEDPGSSSDHAHSGEQLFAVPNQFCTTDDDPIGCLMDGGTTVAPNNARTEFCTHGGSGLPTTHNDGVVVGGQLFKNYQQVYNQESCWETIARIAGLVPPEELQTDDPSGLEPIEWEVLNDLNYLVLAVDRSASMFAADRSILLAQEAAGRIVDLLHAEATVEEENGTQTVIPGEYLSIVGFGPESEILFPIQEILEESTKDQARTVIENLPPVLLDLEQTDFLSMLETSLAQIETQGPTPACGESIILLSDGRHNSGEDLNPVLERLADRGVEVYAVGVGEDIDADLLHSITEATTGQFFRASHAEDLPGIFTAIAAAVRADGVLFAGSDSTDFEGESLPFLIDSLAEEVTTIGTYEGGILDLALVTPTGERITVESAEAREDVEAARSDGFVFIRVLRPESGEWIAELEPTEIEDQIYYDLTVLGGDRNIVIDATTSKTYFDGFPGPVRVSVDVIADVPVAGALVSGKVLRPDGTTLPVEFFDDGDPAHDDDWADDGRYTAVFGDWSADGSYEFQIDVVNIDGTGPDPDLPFVEDGADPPATLPPFVRQASLAIVLDTGIWTVSGTLELPGGLDLTSGNDPTLIAAIELPDRAVVEDIDVATVRLAGSIQPIPGSAAIGDRDEDGIADLSLEFEESALVEVLGIGMETRVRIAGQFQNGLGFETSSKLPVLRPVADSRVLLPGSMFVTGSAISLSWPESDPSPIEYSGYISRNDGLSWELAFEAGETAEFDWNVTGPATDRAKLLVEARSPERVVAQYASDRFNIVGDATDVDTAEPKFGFLGVQPHPVQSEAVLQYALAEAGPVDFAIYDVSGRLVRTLVSSQTQSAGIHSVAWDTTDDHGRAVSSGIYLYVLNFPGTRAEGRIAVLR